MTHHKKKFNIAELSPEEQENIKMELYAARIVAYEKYGLPTREIIQNTYYTKNHTAKLKHKIKYFRSLLEEKNNKL